MFAQVTDDGQTHLIMEMITDWDKDEYAVPINKKYETIKRGLKRLRQTKQGWKLCVL